MSWVSLGAAPAAADYAAARAKRIAMTPVAGPGQPGFVRPPAPPFPSWARVAVGVGAGAIVLGVLSLFRRKS